MVLETLSNIIQTKNAMTQYVTIPSTMVADSQYPFRDAGKVKITVEPEAEMMIITRDDVKTIPHGEVTVTPIEDGFVVKSRDYKDLRCVFFVRQPSKQT